MFFADNIDLLKRFSHFNVLCRNNTTGRYCYAFYNQENGNLSTGYELEKNQDLSIILEKDEWSYIPIEQVVFD